MARPSSIDRLPGEIREAIGRLRQAGHTIDEIMGHLADMQSQVSRSALGRHVQGLDALGEKMRRSRVVAESLVRELGDAPESKAARLNIELLHTAILDLFMRAADEEKVNPEGKAALDGNPQGVMMLAKALDHLARSSKSNHDFMAAAEARAAKRAQAQAQADAAVAVESVARENGLSVDTVAAIKAKIFGVKT